MQQGMWLLTVNIYILIARSFSASFAVTELATITFATIGHKQWKNECTCEHWAYHSMVITIRVYVPEAQKCACIWIKENAFICKSCSL